MLWLRARAQRLTEESRRKSTPEAVLRDAGGLQAQLLDAAALGIRARSLGLRLDYVDRALREERSIARTWLMRGTLHLVAADDLRWLLGIFGPHFAAGNRARHAQLGLTDDVKARGVRAIRQILAKHGPLTRYQLVDRLEAVGIHLNPRSQAPIHLIACAAFKGVCCLGPERSNGEPTYVLLDDWIKPTAGPSRPLGELARRYFSAYGPAGAPDFAAWSGLKAVDVRTGIQDAIKGLEEVTHDRLSLFLPKGRYTQWKRPDRPRRDVRLLPAFDTYLLGYRSRDLAVDRSLQKRLQRGGGWIHPAIVMDGRAIGAWSLKRTGNKASIVLETAGQSLRPIRSQLEMEARDVGAFLGVRTELQLSR